MVTSSAEENRRRLTALLTIGHQDDPDRFRAVPAGVAELVPDGWLWAPGGPVHPATTYGLQDPRAYIHVLPGRDPRPLYASPEAALAAADPVRAREYVRHSVDLTMKGGTTSGVVYPMAVCEIARRAVLRNIGGSSAGAIAAAGAAAAELGRSKLAGVRSTDADAKRRAEDGGPRPEPELAAGRVHTGFAGLADVAAWLAEDDNKTGPELYRLGQLFRPAPRTRAVFRVLVAVMLRQFSRVPLLLTGALGPIGRALTILLLLAGPALVCWASPGWRLWPGYPVAAAGLIALSLVVISGPVVVLLLSMGRRRRHPSPEPLREPVLPPRPVPSPPVGVAVAALMGGLVLSAVVWALLPWTGLRLAWWPLIATWLIVTLGVVFVQVASIVRLVMSARDVGFGLVAGSVHQQGPMEAGVERAISWWDRVAGMPPPTVEPALMDWLNDALNDLAGLADGEVLRFGHLWQGAGFGTSADEEFLVRAAEVSGARQINLELMTSELVHGVPLRFPLGVEDVRDPAGVPIIFVRRSDLTGPRGDLLPEAVIDVICPPSVEPMVAHDARTGEAVEDLYPLPMPWDLPVLLAVRMSMSLPILFQAVRMYRTFSTTDVREDFGLRLTGGTGPLRYPSIADHWVEELWLADGGIASNFPIHFFDSVLPSWPTLGINLGEHPPGSAHQDVWLPSDSDRVETPATPLNGSLISFLSGVLNTGLNWRDTVQTVMPAYRGRVATVRVRPGEGGSNLFMGREQVAGLAVRGAMAGVRLSRRFQTDAHWHRHQYLRARVGLGNLARLSRSVGRAMAQDGYEAIVADGSGFLDGVVADLADVCDPNPPRATGQPDEDQVMPWFGPPDGMWESAQGMLNGLAHSPVAGLQEDLPQPSPDLKQVPRL